METHVARPVRQQTYLYCYGTYSTENQRVSFSSSHGPAAPAALQHGSLCRACALPVTQNHWWREHPICWCPDGLVHAGSRTCSIPFPLLTPLPRQVSVYTHTPSPGYRIRPLAPKEATGDWDLHLQHCPLLPLGLRALTASGSSALPTTGPAPPPPSPAQQMELQVPRQLPPPSNP